MRSNLGRFHRPMSRGLVNNMLTMNNLGDGSTLSLDFTTMGNVLDPRLTFSRAGGGTYVGPDGYIYGIDSATSASLAIGTGSKSVTLTATASVDRRFQVGQTVYFSSGANNMNGLVTAYDASTQVITINATATIGSGSFTSWFVGNASPRFDYSPTNIGEPRGLLVEGQTANLFSYSEDFSNGSWLKSNATASTNATTAPDGNATADYMLETAGTSTRYFAKDSGSPGTSTEIRTFSVYVKVLGRQWVSLCAGNGSGGPYYRITADLSTGTISSTDYDNDGPWFTTTPTNSISPAGPAGSGWYRITITSRWCQYYLICPSNTASPSPASTNFGFGSAYLGDTNQGVVLWGAQLELGSGASSYIPTGASQVTRNADLCSMTGSNFTNVFGDGSLGTITCSHEFSRADRGVTHQPTPFAIGSYTATNARGYSYGNYTLGVTSNYGWVFTSAAFSSAATSAAFAAKNKCAIAYNGLALTAALNGTTNSTTGSGTITVSSAIGLQIGYNTTPRDFINACVSNIKFYPTALTAAQLQILTTP